MVTSITIIFICSYLAFSLSALCGGGAGLILMPVLGAILPVSQVPAALSIGTFSSSASRLVVFYRNICWHIVVYFVPAALPAVWLGAWLLKFVNPVYLEMVMGLFLILNLPLVFKKSSETYEARQPTNLFLMFIGFLAGFLSGLTGAVGLLFNRFYLRYGLTNQEIVATRAANEIVLHVIKIVLYTLFGLITAKALTVGLAVAVSAVLSTCTIKFVLPLLSEFIFKKIGYTAMVLSGAVMLGQAGTDLIGMNNGYLSTKIAIKGTEAKVQWQNANYSIEYSYNDDDHQFSFEQVISFSDLSEDHQNHVLAQKGTADKIVIEAVYQVDEKSYEAYYFKNNKLIKKIDFE
jgi:uncharacterized membrane protein YfcA